MYIQQKSITVINLFINFLIQTLVNADVLSIFFTQLCRFNIKKNIYIFFFRIFLYLIFVLVLYIYIFV